MSIGVVAGLLNGIGFLAYSHLLGGGTYEVSRIVGIVTAVVPIVAAIFGYSIFREPITANKLLGIVLACAGIYLLNGK